MRDEADRVVDSLEELSASADSRAVAVCRKVTAGRTTAARRDAADHRKSDALAPIGSTATHLRLLDHPLLQPRSAGVEGDGDIVEAASRVLGARLKEIPLGAR